MEKEKYYCCFFCQSGPMNIVASLPYSGFVPGQNIPLNIELDNNSNVAVKRVKIKLEKVMINIIFVIHLIINIFDMIFLFRIYILKQHSQ